MFWDDANYNFSLFLTHQSDDSCQPSLGSSGASRGSRKGFGLLDVLMVPVIEVKEGLNTIQDFRRFPILCKFKLLE